MALNQTKLSEQKLKIKKLFRRILLGVGFGGNQSHLPIHVRKHQLK